MSGYPYPSNVNEPGVTGFDYHLTKPLDCDELCSLLKQSLASAGDASTNVLKSRKPPTQGDDPVGNH
jgi:hypothetical protein